MCDNMKRLFFAIFINFLLLNSVSAQHKFTYRTEKLTTCDSIFLVDLSLDNEANKFVFDNVRDALKMAEKVRANGLKRKIRIFFSPNVYWVDDKDDNKIVMPENPNSGVASGIEIKAGNINMIGLTGNPEDVVIAGNRGEKYGADRMYTMFDWVGDDLTMEDLTFGNFCSIDLVYKRNPDLDHEKRTDRVTGAKIAIVRGDRIHLKNCIFKGGKNMSPFNIINGGRHFLENCTIICGENSLPANAVFLNCKFTFNTDKPLYSPMQTGVVFLNCDFSTNEYKPFVMRKGGPATMIDCRWEVSHLRNELIYWTQTGQIDMRAYLSNNTVNGDSMKLWVGPWIPVDITNKPLLRAYKLADGTYNIFNLMRGEDDWNPTKQNTEGLKKIPTLLSVTQRRIQLENEVDEVNIGAKAYMFSDLNNPVPAKLTWDFEKPSYKEYLRITQDDQGRCTVKGIKENENEKNVTFIKVTSANGLESSSRINIYPRQLPPPEFTKTPELKRVKDELVLNYKLDLQNGLRDESVIKWYRCVKDKDGNPVKDKWYLTATTNVVGEPHNRYKLTRADEGYIIKASIATKHQRCEANPQVWSYTSDVIRNAPKQISYDVNVKYLPTQVQPDIVDGVWTMTVNKPADTKKYKWPVERQDSLVWLYDMGIDGAANSYGLTLAHRGARMMFTPESHIVYKAMSIQFDVDPCKEIGQGFAGNNGQYMDLYIMYNNRTNSGYALRIFRDKDYDHAVKMVFLKYTNGEYEKVCEPVAVTGFRRGCHISVEMKGKKLTASLTNKVQVPYDTLGIPAEASLTAVVEPSTFGGFGLQHTGSIGGSGIVIKGLKLDWK